MSHKWQSYDTRFLRYQARWTEFFCHFTIFCSFTPLTTLKIKTLRIWNKNPWRYYHFIQVYHKWQWCMVPEMWSVTQFFVILDCFLLFYLLTTRKIKTLKNWKKPPEISSDHILYCSLDMTCNRSNCYFSFWAIFLSLHP